MYVSAKIRPENKQKPESTESKYDKLNVPCGLLH
jgi:hypothetical protein